MVGMRHRGRSKGTRSLALMFTTPRSKEYMCSHMLNFYKSFSKSTSGSL